jgi:hypothetical protein
LNLEDGKGWCPFKLKNKISVVQYFKKSPRARAMNVSNPMYDSEYLKIEDLFYAGRLPQLSL